MLRSRRVGTRLHLLTGAAALGALALAAAALASVTVYKNDFSNRSKVRQLSHTRGKHCDRDFLKGVKALGVTVTNGPETCAESPPVSGDGPRPDHILQARGKLLKGTARRIRDTAFLMLAVRVGGDGRYELRVFPRTQEFQLLRKPGGDGFPVAGSDNAINGVGKRNRLILQAKGNEVKAKVNGTKLAAVTDSSPGDLNGAKLELGAGNRASSSRNTAASYDRLRVMVPNP